MVDHSGSLSSYKLRGTLFLYGALFGSLCLVLLATWKLGEGIILLPFLLLGLVGFVFLFKYPRVNLICVLVGFLSLTNYSEGFQIIEVLYGLYLITYLGYWFITQLFVYHEGFIKTNTDRAVILMLVLVTLYVPLAVVFGSNPANIFREWIAFVLLGLYFPVKEEIRKHPEGAFTVLCIIGIIGCFVAIRNFIFFRELISSATQLWEVAKGRIVMNDDLLMIASLYGLTLLLFSKRWHHQLLMLGAFLLFFGGLLLTQSRGYWLAFLVGAGALFLLIDGYHRKRLLAIAFGGSVILTAVAFIFLQDIFILVIGGLIDRFSSLQTAATTDLSLLNRFRETAAVWELIEKNPILGYGQAYTYNFFDITRGTTDTDAFVHNGYISLWFKYGIVGLGLVMFFWLNAIRSGVKAFKTRGAPASVRLTGLIGVICLSAFLLSALTSNPFFLNDTLFVIGILLSLAEGTYQRIAFKG